MDDRTYARYMSDIAYFLAKWEADPESKYFIPICLAYNRLQKYEETISLCREGLEKFPSSYAAKTLLAEAYVYKGDLERARELLFDVLTEDDNNYKALKLLGIVYKAFDMPEEALKYFKGAYVRSPDDAELKQTIEDMGSSVEIDDLIESRNNTIQGDKTEEDEDAKTFFDIDQKIRNAEQVMADLVADKSIMGPKRDDSVDDNLISDDDLEKLISMAEHTNEVEVVEDEEFVPPPESVVIDDDLARLMNTDLSGNTVETPNKISEVDTDLTEALGSIDEVDTDLTETLGSVDEVDTDLTEALGSIDEVDTDLTEALGSIDDVDTDLTEALDSIDDVDTDLTEALDSIDDVDTDLTEALGSIDEVDTDLTEALGSIDEVDTDLTEALGSIDEVDTDLAEALGSIDDVDTDLTEALGSMDDVDTDLSEALGSIDEVDTDLAEVLGSIAEDNKPLSADSMTEMSIEELIPDDNFEFDNREEDKSNENSSELGESAPFVQSDILDEIFNVSSSDMSEESEDIENEPIIKPKDHIKKKKKERQLKRLEKSLRKIKGKG